MPEMIKVSHLTKDYGEHRGVFDLDFSVREGEVMGFLGPNGAGKTTTIRQLMGYIRPDDGKCFVSGMECFKFADKIRNNMGYLPGEIAFIDAMTGNDFIKFQADMKKMGNLGRAQEIIDMFELKADGKIKKMSKGMKQKIGIVCAFMDDPDILILDEPTSGLDPLMQNRFIDLILSEKERGKTILMSSHIFEEVERTCDRAVIIRDGEMVACDSIDRLLGGKKKTLEITMNDGSKVTAKIGDKVNGKQIADMTIKTQTLEEYFLNFYEGGKE